MNAAPPQDEGTAPGLRGFADITLAQLNARAAQMERQDRKYIIQAPLLEEALDEWRRHFDVLKIEGRTSFQYRSRYFDDDDYSSYYDHHMGRRIRFKVRTRHYVDADQYYLEMKLKGPRGRTLKIRIAHLAENFAALDDGARAYIGRTYFDVYGRQLQAELKPSIGVNYSRISLVAKHGGARITIDRNLVFAAGSDIYAVDSGKVILETKSGNGNAIADQTLRRLHQHPVSRCSKYCIGLVALGRGERYNNFRPVMRKLNVAAAAPSS